MARSRAGIALAAAVLVAALAFSGDAATDPPLPRGFPGVLPAFMGGDDRGGDRRWLSRGRALRGGTPRWARRMYRRSLLVLRALTDPRTGAVVAGAREGWAYVWPRDAAAAAIAFAAAGYRPEARGAARFLLGLDLEAAARFRRTGEPVPVRAAQGDAPGWVAAAARAAGVSPVATAARGSGRNARQPTTTHWLSDTGPGGPRWRDRADYQEGDPGDYLGNAVAVAALPALARAGPTTLGATFGSRRGLVRVADDPGSGLDAAAAWAVRPFRVEALYPAARRTLLRIAADAGRFGIVPSESWSGGEDPWTASTAWAAWGLAALAREDGGSAAARRRCRRAALRLLVALHRASTPLGLLPERVDAHTGEPRSTTPLAWSHAFAILALRELRAPGRGRTGRVRAGSRSSRRAQRTSRHRLGPSSAENRAWSAGSRSSSAEANRIAH